VRAAPPTAVQEEQQPTTAATTEEPSPSAAKPRRKRSKRKDKQPQSPLDADKADTRKMPTDIYDKNDKDIDNREVTTTVQSKPRDRLEVEAAPTTSKAAAKRQLKARNSTSDVDSQAEKTAAAGLLLALQDKAAERVAQKADPQPNTKPKLHLVLSSLSEE
jgi:hypothetical protein